MNQQTAYRHRRHYNGGSSSWILQASNERQAEQPVSSLTGMPTMPDWTRRTIVLHASSSAVIRVVQPCWWLTSSNTDTRSTFHLYYHLSLQFYTQLHEILPRDDDQLNWRGGDSLYRLLTTILQIWSPTSCPAPCHAGSVSAASSDIHHMTSSHITSQRHCVMSTYHWTSNATFI